MKAFDDIKYEPPPYPVFKAYFVPYREDEKILDCRRLTDGDVELWRSLLIRLKEFLKVSVSMVKSVRTLSREEELELIDDLIALFFRIPLLREAFPSVALSPLKMYLLLRLYPPPIEELAGDPLSLIRAIHDKAVTERFRESEVVRLLIDPELYEDAERCWLIFPADTRPALNTSNLIPHLLLTSAIAWAKAIQEGVDRERAALIRLAAMLHDMGKPFKYHRHVEASREVAEALLSPILPEDDMRRIVDFISTHHAEARTREGKILGDADRIASNIDRLQRVAEEIIGGRIRELAERFGLNHVHAYSSGWESWDFWETIYREAGETAIRELSGEFVRKLRGEMENYTKMPERILHIMREEREWKVYEGITLALLDLGGIQSFIRRTIELKCVAASSLVIDTLIMAQIPLLLQLKALKKGGVWLPYEAFLYSAGGIVELLLPRKLGDIVGEAIRDLGEKTRRHGLPLRFSDPAPLSSSYTHTIRELVKRIQLRKNRVEVEREGGEAIKPGELCQICYLDKAKEEKWIKGERRRVCETCSELYDIGRDIHFGARYHSEMVIKPGVKVKPKDIFNIRWDGEEKTEEVTASRYIIEMVAGHDKDELEALREGEIERRDVAAIRVDGNLIGAFMATCLSPTDAYERSARIDLALKKSIEAAISALYDGVVGASYSEEEAKRAASSVKLGILYAGGDDAAILAPAWVSPIIALILGHEFRRSLGEVRGLSIGVAAASAKGNIWGLLDAAQELMEKAKGRGRENPGCSSIAFDIITSGSFSGVAVDARFDILSKRKLTSQPLIIDPCDERSLDKLLSLILKGQRDYSGLFGEAYRISRVEREDLAGGVPLEEVRGEKRRVKGIREVIGRVLSTVENLTSERVGEGWSLALLAAHIFARRQIMRLEKAGRDVEAYRCVRELLPRRLGELSLLSDADRLIQILGGGVL